MLVQDKLNEILIKGLTTDVYRYQQYFVSENNFIFNLEVVGINFEFGMATTLITRILHLSFFFQETVS